MFLLGMIAFMSLTNFRCVIRFGAKLFEDFVNISCFDPCLDLRTKLPPRVLSTQYWCIDSFLSLMRLW